MLLKPDKCIISVDSVDFLGHQLSAEGVTPLQEKVDAVTNFTRPRTVKGLQEFIGMITYYHRFLPGIANILTPLHNLLTGRPKSLQWTHTAEAAFENAKRALARATMLSYPDPDAPIQLVTDASAVAVGAALQQKNKDRTQTTCVLQQETLPGGATLQHV